VCRDSRLGARTTEETASTRRTPWEYARLVPLVRAARRVPDGLPGRECTSGESFGFGRRTGVKLAAGAGARGASGTGGVSPHIVDDVVALFDQTAGN
jgi:hypothetical protein